MRIPGDTGGEYSGIMPENYGSKANPELVPGSGIAQMGALNQSNILTTPNGQGVGVLQRQFLNPRPVSVQLAYLPAGAGIATPFPPPPVGGGAAHQSGLVDNTGATINPLQAYMAAIIEYGCGAVTQRLFCDWKPGAINLPASDFVSVTAMLWGAAAALPSRRTVQASVAVGTVDGTHVPTASGSGVFLAGVPRQFQVPAAARAIGVIAVSALNPVITITGGAYGYFDYANKVFVPSSAVVEILGDVGVTIASSIDCTLAVTWYLQP